jgi:ribosomal 50S subunit-recycling heat shock protein
MDPIAVDIRLIRAMLGGELKVVPGRAMMARVVAADGLGRGTLTIAGAVIDAELPKHVQAGQELRLTVRHVSAEQVVLGLADQTPPAASAAVPLPGGGAVRVAEDSDSDGSGRPGGSRGSQTLSLRYDAPTLGAVDLRFELDPGSLRVRVEIAPGTPLSLAQDRAERLRDALTDGVGRPASVTVAPRHEPLDLYA